MTAAPDNPSLQLAAEALGSSKEFADVVWQHFPDQYKSGPRSVALTQLRTQDQMLRHSLREWSDANSAMSEYFNVALQQHSAFQQVLRSTFKGNLSDLRVLDFACGWGRLLRFLVYSIPPSAIWASDIQREALEDVVREFGVKGIYSDVDPEVYRPNCTFDLIWVASLFSHLPEDLFLKWLKKLTLLLTPRGVLAFSVHGEASLPADAAMSERGIYFRSSSEIEEFDSSLYGTSYVTEAFVSRALTESGEGLSRSHVLLKRALAGEQDLYLVANDDTQTQEALHGFRRGPWGCVDIARTRGRFVELVGWATSLDDGPLDAVVVRVGDRVFRCLITVQRDDVADFLGDRSFARSGFDFRAPLASPETFVVVTAVTERNEKAMLYAGPLSPTEGGPPWGSVDAVRMSGSEFEMSGWAASTDGKPLDRLTVCVGEREHRVPIDGDRADVAAAMNDPGMARCGWAYRGMLPSPDTRVVVTATSRKGEKTELYAGVVKPA